ncbi:RDD family protein [Xanthomonas sp. Kuri4-1]
MVYAGLWRRVAANIIDGLVTSVAVYALLIPVLLVFGVGAWSVPDGAHGQGAALGLMAFVYGTSLLLPALYTAWMQSSRHQATLGKLACGIKVVRSDGSQLRFWRSLLRYGVYVAVVLLTLGLGLLASGLMAGLTRRKQAPHDLACDTLVVDRWAFTAHPEHQRDRLDTVSIVVLALYGICVVIALAAVVFLVGMIRLGQH